MAIEFYPGARAIPASLAKARPRFTVAIPTFERPAYLRRAVLSVLVQTLFPDEVLVVHRRDDNETVMTFDRLLYLPHGIFFASLRSMSLGFFRQSGKPSKIALAM